MSRDYAEPQPEEYQDHREMISRLIWGSFPQVRGGVQRVISSGQLRDGREVEVCATAASAAPFPYGTDVAFLQSIIQAAQGTPSRWVGLSTLAACYLDITGERSVAALENSTVRREIVEAVKRLSFVVFAVTFLSNTALRGASAQYTLVMTTAARHCVPAIRRSWTRIEPPPLHHPGFGLLLDESFLAIMQPIFTPSPPQLRPQHLRQLRS